MIMILLKFLQKLLLVTKEINMAVHWKPETGWKPQLTQKKLVRHIYGYVGTQQRFLGLSWGNPEEAVKHFTEIGYDRVFVQ